jgi:hypothetical protein
MVILSQNDCVKMCALLENNANSVLHGIKVWASVSSSARLLQSTKSMTHESVL